MHEKLFILLTFDPFQFHIKRLAQETDLSLKGYNRADDEEFFHY